MKLDEIKDLLKYCQENPEVIKDLSKSEPLTKTEEKPLEDQLKDLIKYCQENPSEVESLSKAMPMKQKLPVVKSPSSQIKGVHAPMSSKPGQSMMGTMNRLGEPKAAKQQALGVSAQQKAMPKPKLGKEEKSPKKEDSLACPECDEVTKHGQKCPSCAASEGEHRAEQAMDKSAIKEEKESDKQKQIEAAHASIKKEAMKECKCAKGKCICNSVSNTDQKTRSDIIREHNQKVRALREKALKEEALKEKPMAKQDPAATTGPTLGSIIGFPGSPSTAPVQKDEIKGVHKPSGQGIGISPAGKQITDTRSGRDKSIPSAHMVPGEGASSAGVNARAYFARKSATPRGPTAGQFRDQAVQEHKKVLGEMKSMPKPELGKEELGKGTPTKAYVARILKIRAEKEKCEAEAPKTAAKCTKCGKENCKCKKVVS